jgi:hypothetical protein
MPILFAEKAKMNSFIKIENGFEKSRFSTFYKIINVKTDQLTRINMLGESMWATRHTNTPVKAGDFAVATLDIPLLIDRKIVEETIAIVSLGNKKFCRSIILQRSASFPRCLSEKI